MRLKIARFQSRKPDKWAAVSRDAAELSRRAGATVRSLKTPSDTTHLLLRRIRDDAAGSRRAGNGSKRAYSPPGPGG